MTDIVSLKQQQVQARKDYMRNKDPRTRVEVNLLTTLIGEIESKAKIDGNDVSEDLVNKTITKFLKGVEEHLKIDAENVKATQEREILEKFLPQQMSETELRIAISTILVERNIVDIKNMGQVMGALKQNYNGKYDGALASAIVKELLK